MAFYIVVKSRITPFDFPYLDHNQSVRLDPTLIHGQKPKPHQNVDHKEVYAIDVMTKNVVSLSPASRIKEAKFIMDEKKIHHIPLVIDFKMTGLISSRDIPENPDFHDGEIRLDKVMTKMVLCASDSTPLRHVAHVFLKENINDLPIIDDELRLCGIITHRDLLGWLINNNKFSS